MQSSVVVACAGVQKCSGIKDPLCLDTYLVTDAWERDGLLMANKSIDEGWCQKA